LLLTTYFGADKDEPTQSPVTFNIYIFIILYILYYIYDPQLTFVNFAGNGPSTKDIANCGTALPATQADVEVKGDSAEAFAVEEFLESSC
jgi:hypothetical protein